MNEKCYIIPIQKDCNCNCTFCISKIRDYNKECSILKVDDDFVNNIYLLKKRGIKKFEITGGGEPLLNPHINLIIDTIKKIIPDSYIKLYTNGNILKKLKNVDEIDISVVHYDDEINSKFMGNTKVSLLEKIKYFKNANNKLRLSIPIIKGAIDSEKRLDKVLELTREYVDEYVVRTLYPKTPHYNTLYEDFDYDNQLVILEKDNDVKDFNGLILWSDGKIYNNFKLDKERFLNSYLLLKPDSQIYINEIVDLIKKNNFEIKDILFIEDFIKYASMFYKDKDENYLKLVKNHLINTAYLFGNHGLIMILDKCCSLDQLFKETFALKKEIRNNFSFTHHMGGYIKIGDGLAHLNLVHSPEVDCFERDMELINNTLKCHVSEEDFALIKKYRSYHI